MKLRYWFLIGIVVLLLVAHDHHQAHAATQLAAAVVNVAAAHGFGGAW